MLRRVLAVVVAAAIAVSACGGGTALAVSPLDNGDGLGVPGPLCDGDFSQILQQLPSSSDIRSALPYYGHGSCWTISAYRPYGPGLAMGNFADAFVFEHLAGVNPCVVGAAKAAGPADGGIVESVSTDVVTVDPGDGNGPRAVVPLSSYCPSVSVTDLVPNLQNLYLRQTFSHSAGQTLEVTVAPVHAYAFGLTDGLDYSYFGQFRVSLSGTGDQFLFNAYGASGTIEIPLRSDQSADQLLIQGEGIAVTHVAVVDGPAATPTAVPSSTPTAGPSPTATATVAGIQMPASADCGYLLDCNFVKGPAVVAGSCGTTIASCVQDYSGAGGPWTTSQCFNDANMGIAESSPMTRTWGAWQCRRIGQVVSIPSAQPGDVVHLSFYGRSIGAVGTAGDGNGPMLSDLNSCGIAGDVGAANAAGPAVSQDWQLYTGSCAVTTSGFNDTFFVGSGGNGTTSGAYEVMSPTVLLYPGGSPPATPAPPTGTPLPPVGGTPGCTLGPGCETAVAATVVADGATKTAVAATVVADGTPPPPVGTVQAWDCLNLEQCTGVLVTPGPPVTLGGSWDGGSDTSPCTAVSWPVWRSPPADLFPSSLDDVLVVGGVVDAAAWLVGGAWSVVQQTIVPQHATCDLSPVYNAVKAKDTLPDTTPLVSVFHVPAPTCGWFGVRGLVVLSHTFDLGWDGCASPWPTVFAELRGILVVLLWMGFSLSVARGIERRVRVPRGGDA